ncbi:hypothetical protein [Streptomyces sp. NPDC020377]|uniref:hypothetical protein n=1 Tax=Streptomyces sp. NPDC020377 TaxID=3365070 RepID=UPI00036338D7
MSAFRVPITALFRSDEAGGSLDRRIRLGVELAAVVADETGYTAPPRPPPDKRRPYRS